MKYLLIDDNNTFADLLKRSFARHELLLDCVTSGEEALALHPQYDRIILDLNLGDTTGLQWLPELTQYFNHAEILILTGYASISTAVKAMQLGAINYLPKPARTPDIIEAFSGKTLVHDDHERPSLKRLTWEHINYRLQMNDGNVSATARDLKMHRRTLQRMLHKHAIQE